MPRLITIDFETYYSKDYGLKKYTTEHYIRDKQFQVIGFAYKIDDGQTQWVTGTDKQITEALQALDIPSAYLICHNMAFDGAILAWRFSIKPKYYLDTLSMARPVTGLTVGGSLAALAKKYLLDEKGTEVVNALGLRREVFPADQLARYGEYCKHDVDLTYALYHVFKQWNPPKELYIQDLMIRMFTDPVLELNRTVLIDHLFNVQDKKGKLMERIEASIGRDALMSNPKFAEVLKKLGVEPPTKISLRTNKETYAFGKTDQAFKALAEHHDPRVQAVVAARLGIKSTLEETRTESFIGIAERGTLPILLNYWGAHTGRASGGDKMNLQNLPRGGALRRSIRAPEGHSLVVADSSQIEARVLGWLAGQDALTQAFANKEDVYCLMASSIYGRVVTKADKVERQMGKTVVLGCGYGLGHAKFRDFLKVQTGIVVDETEAKRIIDVYRSTNNCIQQLWKSCHNALGQMSKGFDTEIGVGIALRCTPEGVHLPNGTMIRYPNLRKNADGYEYDGRYGPVKIYGGKMVENIVQALARIVVFDQMAKIDIELRKNDNPDADRRYKVVLTVHDECCIIVPTNTVLWAKEFLSSAMSVAPKWAVGLPITCECEAGENYAECK